METFSDMVNYALDLLEATEGTTAFSRAKEFAEIKNTLEAGVLDEKRAAAMNKLARYLITFDLRHEAYYFYFEVLKLCQRLKLEKCTAERVALLQIAKLIGGKKMELDENVSVDSNLQTDILRFLVDKYQSSEAMALLFD